MANPLLIEHKSKMIEQRTLDIFNKIQQDYDKGRIQTEVEYHHRLYSGLEDLYASIGKPTLKLRIAEGVPFSSDYYNMLREIHEDLTLLYAEGETVGEAVGEGLRRSDIAKQQLSNRIAKIEDKLKDIEEKAKYIHQELMFRDSFMNEDRFDKGMTEGTPAHLFSREGMLTLAPSQSENFLQDTTVRITSGNGFPGNTKQAKSVGGALKFVGEDQLSTNVASIVDGEAESWLEYELFDISERVRNETSNIGFDFKEGMSWLIHNDDELRLTVEITLPYPKVINWFSVDPFIPNDKGATAGYITSILIDDGKGQITEVLTTPSEVFDNERVYLFSEQECHTITVHLSQPFAYETDIGHLFFKETHGYHVNFFQDEDGQEGRRVEGPMPSVENVELKYNPYTKALVQPEMKQKDQIEYADKKKQELFNAPDVGYRTQAGFEILPAYRYALGIQSVQISSYRFQEKSEYVSTIYKTDRPIRGVFLQTVDQVPREFPEEEDWIEYYITVNNGHAWEKIHPQGSRMRGVIRYEVNSNVPREGRRPEYGYLETLDPVYEVRVKAVLKRPKMIKNGEYLTPIIREYRLHVVTEREDEI